MSSLGVVNDVLVEVRGDTMNPFQKEIFIRLSNDRSGFCCRTRYGKVFSKTTEFLIGESVLPAVENEPELLLVNEVGTRHPRGRYSPEPG
jgi:hypothetical protein